MAITLYDLSVASYVQTLGAAEGFLEKGRKYCNENGIDLNEVVETRLFPDMLPFRFQIVSIAHHSLGAIKGVMAGEFQPPAGMGEFDYSALQKLIAEARTELQGYTPDAVNAREGQEIIFQMGEHRLPFTAENFVLSFSMPNFYFHATTAYDILRMKGVPIGKRDFMGALRLNR